MRNRIMAWMAAPMVALGTLAGCGDDGGVSSEDGGRNDGSPDIDGAPGGPDGGGPGPTDGGWVWGDGGCREVTCQDHLYECADCEDNDGDGRIDFRDPDCLGPCDNNEQGYNLDIPGGDSAPCKLDCYYDQDEGQGNDQCEWDARCDPKEPDPNPLCSYDPDHGSASCPDPQADHCHDFCDPLIPNGCDCFGCCTFSEISGRSESDGGEFVFIGSVDSDGTPSCTLDDVSDTEKCHPCTPVEDCYNDCTRCELCVGETSIPDDCSTGERCPDGVQPCGLEGDDECPDGTSCISGCCQASELF